MTYEHWRPHFAKAIDTRLFSIEHLDAMVSMDLAQVWASDKAGLVTEIRNYPTGARTIEVVVAAGDRDEITGPLREQAEEWAKSIGCGFVIVSSREGWRKALRPFGYGAFQTSLIKTL